MLNTIIQCQKQFCKCLVIKERKSLNKISVCAEDIRWYLHVDALVGVSEERRDFSDVSQAFIMSRKCYIPGRLKNSDQLISRIKVLISKYGSTAQAFTPPQYVPLERFRRI